MAGDYGDVDRASQNADYAKASELKYGRLADLERQLAEKESALGSAQSRLLKEEVGKSAHENSHSLERLFGALGYETGIVKMIFVFLFFLALKLKFMRSMS